MLHTEPSVKLWLCCWFCLYSPLHPTAASRVKPTGQIQMSPAFTMPDGQPQSVPLSTITWIPGRWGATLELGETEVKEAADVKKKKGIKFRRNWGPNQKKKTQQKPKELTCGWCAAWCGFTEISDGILSHLSLKQEKPGIYFMPSHPTRTCIENLSAESVTDLDLGERLLCLFQDLIFIFLWAFQMFGHWQNQQQGWHESPEVSHHLGVCGEEEVVEEEKQTTQASIMHTIGKLLGACEHYYKRWMRL